MLLTVGDLRKADAARKNHLKSGGEEGRGRTCQIRGHRHIEPLRGNKYNTFVGYDCSIADVYSKAGWVLYSKTSVEFRAGHPPLLPADRVAKQGEVPLKGHNFPRMLRNKGVSARNSTDSR